MIDLPSLSSWLQLSDATKLNIYNETGRKIGLPAMAIEKDWWVVHTLALVFSMECSPALIFKGGTSLSKGWNLIQRFSEDIDLALDRQYLGFAGDLTRQEIKKLRKVSYSFMTTKFVEELTTKFAAAGFKNVNIKCTDTGQSDQDPIIIEIYYPKLTETETYLRPGVLVEVGCRSLREPTTKRTFTTLVAERFGDRMFADKSITLPIVNPERTFLEKIFLLHEEFQKAPEKVRVDRLSRHLYDIERLSQTEFAEIALSDLDLYQMIVNHRKMFTALAEVNYDNHSPDKIAFVPPPNLLPAWEADYKQMRENMIFGEALSFEDLIKALMVLEVKLNDMIVKQ
ncbi:nucleotidyl transferase AbiEii/AbiGii toxin family protein [Dyadobacter psychrophilus]|uniref:Predicted nucleotidyltransferase component of viral defense system n=1 Tax=Dyadobacter psychrophilus TaxID=651661 RepID=A0A1T5H2B5_9BACT|nr:nucleotidyl transferase AbiEii/AbiGii toxin family protein [Dyadobacter psychrophilus]SKC14802.1 Predicted nucleotidyltransferase component of viral defense system [Dyadobacter psychrophilus]